MAGQLLQLQRVVGVTFDTRAEYVRQLQVGDAVWLQIDQTNRHDAHAVQVLNSAGDQLGFIAARNSERVGKYIEVHSLEATVVEVSRATGKFPYLVIKLANPAVPTYV
ncbi:hypothetical protein ABBQ38_008603 [Trebouxia sp. C0009 RCD-2024]